MSIFKKGLYLILAIACCSAPAWATIGPGHHVNIVSLQQDDEYQDSIDYPKELKGSFADILALFKGKAEPFLMLHTPHIHPKDTVNAQVDALGERSDQSLEDDGLNCEFLFDQKGDDFTLGGICNVIIAGEEKNTTNKYIIKPQAIPSSSKNAENVWKRLFVDANGTAFYASIER